MKKCTFKIVTVDFNAEGHPTITKENTGYEVDILGLRCFVDKRTSRCWVITEAMSGFSFANGNTRDNAIQSAKLRLETVGPGIIAKELIKSARSVWVAGLSWPVNAD